MEYSSQQSLVRGCELNYTNYAAKISTSFHVESRICDNKALILRYIDLIYQALYVNIFEAHKA